MIQVLALLRREVQEEKELIRKLMLLQQRLRFGWGTLRVAVGMAVGSFIYQRCIGMAQGDGGEARA